MSSARALANQKLYHAKILIRAWRGALAEEQVAQSVLAGAFAGAICQHLAAAYGWFLLEIVQPADMPSSPPLSCAQLPPVAEGREVSPEISEFQRLEREPWLAHILNPPAGHSTRPVQSTGSGNLAMPGEDALDPAQALQWHTQLTALFERMTDSLDEY